tara:strand:+ start:659 stop:2149 length:1491 start_codon:yes stop_codon:yes gene_type:complete
MPQQDATSKVILGIDVREFRKGIQKVDSSLKGISRKFQNLGGVIGASFAVSHIQKFGAEAIELNSQLTKAAAGFKRFGDASVLREMRKSTMGLVTDLELMQQSVKGANLGIPIKDMGTLLEFAKRRADETGESMDHLVNSIVEGIGRKSTRRLDNLGISAQRLKEEVGGISLEMADVADVSAAMTRIAVEELDKMGEATITTADKFTQLSIEFENAKAGAGELFASLGLLGLQLLKVGKYNDMFYDRPDAPKAIEDPKDPSFFAPSIYFDPNTVKQMEAPIQTLKDLQDQVANLEKELKGLDITSLEFVATLNELEDLQTEIKSLKDLNDFVSLGAKSFAEMNLEVKELPRVINQVGRFLEGSKKQFKSFNKTIDESVLVLNSVSRVGVEIGRILETSFNSAMNNGEDFFETMRNGLRNYAKQMAVATGATLALAAALSIIFPKIGFNALFKSIGTGMGLPFASILGSGTSQAVVKGNDLFVAIERNTTANTRIGG